MQNSEGLYNAKHVAISQIVKNAGAFTEMGNASALFFYKKYGQMNGFVL